ncbi:MAG: cytidine deaminase [Prevotellaceae bacterium]|nr:cytidine deaminase [Prevotellaceae bacterium]
MKKSSVITLILFCALLFVGCSKDEPESVQGIVAQENLETAIMNGENFDRAQLIRIAIDNMHNSYAPYSKYNVSAAVVMSSKKIYTGVNVENASYPAGICAERNAIFHAIECGETKILGIAIVGGTNNTINDYCPPCGICRQVMREFCEPNKMHVIFAKSETDYKDMTLEELLPESFGPEALE